MHSLRIFLGFLSCGIVGAVPQMPTEATGTTASSLAGINKTQSYTPQSVEIATPKYTVETITTTKVIGLELPTQPALPPRTMIRVDPQVDNSDPSNLKAKESCTMAYEEASSGQTSQQIATVSISNTGNSVVHLDHSKYIRSIQCSETAITLLFSNQTAYNIAYEDWQGLSNLKMVTANANCALQYKGGGGGFIEVTNLRMENTSMTMHADAQYQSLHEAFGIDALVEVFLDSKQPSLGRRGLIGGIQSAAEGAATSLAGAAESEVSKASSAAAGEVSGAQSEFSSLKSEAQTKAAATDGGTKTMSFSAEATQTDTGGPWGVSHEIYSDPDTKVYCQGCNADGSVVMKGNVVYGLVEGKPTEANISVNGHMNAQLALGLDGTAKKTLPIGNASLIQLAIPGLEIPDILTLGPQIDVDLGASIDVKAAGQLLMGAHLDWPNFSFDADGVAGKAHGDGLTPQMTKISNVSGSVSADLDVHVPVSFGVGINIEPIKFDKEIKLINTIGMKFGANLSDQDPCKGTDLFIDLYDDVGIDIFGFTNVPLASTETTLYDTCISTSTSSTIISSATLLSSSASTPISAPATTTPSSSTFATLRPSNTEGIDFGSGTGSDSGSSFLVASVSASIPYGTARLSSIPSGTARPYHFSANSTSNSSAPSGTSVGTSIGSLPYGDSLSVPASSVLAGTALPPYPILASSINAGQGPEVYSQNSTIRHESSATATPDIPSSSGMFSSTYPTLHPSGTSGVSFRPNNSGSAPVAYGSETSSA